MSEQAADNYAIFFADKLWKLMPAVYRSLDTDQFETNGPLRELTLRIGASAAEVRRNIDRLWDDQSIETCDDWAIPYIADLLGARLVYGLGARGQRLDVANTIDYRRRKGTLAVVEQIAHDITQWDIKAVEFFRRLARNRHGLDPALATPGGAALAQAEGLIGRLTGTPIGGFANLRNVNGAAKAGSGFDEFFYSADTRAPSGRYGWHAISHLGIFVWRLQSFVVGPTTPVAVHNCPGWFCFDPTGRDAPLFCAGASAFGAEWTSPTEAQVPGPMSQALLNDSLLAPIIAGSGQIGAQLKTKGWGSNAAHLPNVGDLLTIQGVNAVEPLTLQDTGVPQVFAITAPVSADINSTATLTIFPPVQVGGAHATVTAAPADGATLTLLGAAIDPLYPASIQVREPSLDPPLVPAEALKLRPQRGRFQWLEAVAPTTIYAYGFPSEIGAGPYDRSGQETPIPAPAPELEISGGGPALTNAPASAATIIIKDSLTYDAPAAPRLVKALTLRAVNRQRPLVRLAAGQKLVFIGASAEATLTLDGLFISGGDIVLKGQFASVTIACCTFDPGNPAPGVTPASPPQSPPSSLYAIAADGRELSLSRLFIDAAIGALNIDRCVLGPVRTREISLTGSPPPDPTLAVLGAGNVETATICNSIVQAIEISRPSVIDAGAVQDPTRLLRRLQLGVDPVAARLRSLRPAIGALFGALASPPLATPPPAPALLTALLNEINAVIAGPSIYDPASFADVALSEHTQQLRAAAHPLQPAPALNRALLEDAFPLDLAEAALAFGDGALNLSRCTVLGRVVAHQLQASECILRQMVQVDDLQDGCIRFSAIARNAQVPRQYECVRIAEGAPLFTTTQFGQPGFAQLAPTADLQRLPAANANGVENSISAGAADGSEMGAYARDKNPIRARALMLKMQEYMPAGLTPVVINVT